MMTLGELFDELRELIEDPTFDERQEVRMLQQPEYPLLADIKGVVVDDDGQIYLASDTANEHAPSALYENL